MKALKMLFLGICTLLTTEISFAKGSCGHSCGHGGGVCVHIQDPFGHLNGKMPGYIVYNGDTLSGYINFKNDKIEVYTENA